MTEVDLLIGKRLQTARRALGFKSARSFARKHGIPESTYSQHETGKRSLNPTTLVAYCDRLKIEPGWLISGDTHTKEMDADTPTADLRLLQSILQKELFKLVHPNAQSQFNHVMAACIDAYKRALQQKQASAVTT
ncbi:MAG: hypothetical protein COB66_02330 [Coxiella sp. (in: Bacteria)]|nr:MAG: hypothetical protein COB66_02330 [Coxiella sp. (in: g-proteobacteria)]